MKTKALLLILIAFLGGSLALLYATITGKLVWFARERTAHIESNGIQVTGYLHKAINTQGIIVTRKMTNGNFESYRVGPLTVDHGGGVANCGEWVAPNIPAFVISAYRPRCWVVLQRGAESPPQNARELSSGTHFVEFTANNGDRVTSSW